MSERNISDVIFCKENIFARIANLKKRRKTA